MEVKTYRAKSIQEAIVQIKQELGADAVILSTKRLPKSSRNPYGQDIFEVIAAPYEDLAQQSQNKAQIQNKAQDDDGETLEQLLNNFVNKKPQSQAVNSTSADQWQTVSSELSQIKDILFLMNQSAGIPDILNAHSECLNIYSRLIKTGISDKIAQALLKKSGAFSDKFASSDAIFKSVLLEILSTITVLNPFEHKNKYKYIAAFVGPTGVGKTTTIAKLAAELGLKQNKTVGLISIDSYRIGAVEQLKTYASIMGVPCFAAFTHQDLQNAIKNLSSKDIILIDTAGHSHLDKKRMKEISSLIEGEHQISCHLVLSANTKSEDIKDATKNFALLSPQTYIFTKLDETRTRGCIIDQIMDTKLPISFITNGQRVPEDIIVANKKNILKIIFN